MKKLIPAFLAVLLFASYQDLCKKLPKKVLNLKAIEKCSEMDVIINANTSSQAEIVYVYKK
ncbi:hypothetical protein [Caminibacter pacificus]